MTSPLLPLEEIAELVFRFLPSLRRGLHQPVAKVRLLAWGEHLLDLVGAALKRLKEAGSFRDVQGRGSDIEAGVGGGFGIVSLSLNPDGNVLFEGHAGAIERRFRVVEDLVLRLSQRNGFMLPKQKIMFPHASA